MLSESLADKKAGATLMRWFRWRIRTLIVLVAVVAVVAAFEEMRRRGERYRLCAEYHLAASQQLDRDRRSFVCGNAMNEEHMARKQAARAAEWKLDQPAVDYHLRLHAKYQLAARRPWLRVDSDPPTPPGANPRLASADEY
jgi:hypothetical protein